MMLHSDSLTTCKIMRTDNTVFETEKSEQFILRLIFWGIATTCVILSLFIIGWNPLTFILLPAAFMYIGLRAKKMEQDFEQRLMKIAFKTHIGNLYVYDHHENDNTTMPRRDAALAMLKETNNEHRVKVFTYMFQDVVIFCNWWQDGVLKESREFIKDFIPAQSTWEDYQCFLDRLKVEKDNEFMLSARKSSTGDQWLNVHYFKQKR